MLPDTSAAGYADNPQPTAPSAEAPLPGDGTASAADLLHVAVRAVTDEFGAENWLASVAWHLIGCAAEVVALLPEGDLQAAREALGTARAAVGIATYAVRRLHDDARTEQPCATTSS
jgi:hypothetical protein